MNYGKGRAMTANARGLFRATGKMTKAMPVFDGEEWSRSDNPDRIAEDFYPTPPEPTRALLHAEGERMRQIGGPVWEAAAGDGAMAHVLRAGGFDVVCSDLVDRGHGGEVASFFDYTTGPSGARMMVTNPPYNLVNARDGRARWLWHALDVVGLDYVALLLNWNWPGAAGLAGFWHEHPPARVYLMRWKIDFTGAGAPPMLSAWFVWDREHRGETVLRMLDRRDANQGELKW